jgi:hypothetical protein
VATLLVAAVVPQFLQGFFLGKKFLLHGSFWLIRLQVERLIRFCNNPC